MRLHLIIILCLFNLAGFGQTQAITNAMEKLFRDEQFTNATISLYVQESGTGKLIYQHNGDLGINPASSLKVVTSAASFELLGKDFTFSTRIAVGRSPANGDQMLIISGGGDPTFGSERWERTMPKKIFESISNSLKANGIKELPGGIYVDNPKFSYQPLPHGWIWEDIGNYFGAGAWGLNWKENIFEIDLLPGREVGDPVTVTATRPSWMMERITCFVTTGEKGSGDQSLVFSAPYQQDFFITGTVPAGGKITISASSPEPAATFGHELKEYLKSAGVSSGPVETSAMRLRAGKRLQIESSTELLSIKSPSFDSINHWFMNKSINLYGEALIKMIGMKKSAEASTEEGIKIVQDLFFSNGIAKGALKMQDGSGLSPTNRVTTSALVKVMEFAQTRPWFNSFLKGIPEMNNMKLKSGYMEGVRSYTGYVTSSTGKKYLVAFVINNFHGNPAAVRQKMWKVLDVLL